MKWLTKWTQLFSWELANRKREVIDTCIKVSKSFWFEEIFLPSINNFELYEDKNWWSIEWQMYTFKDKKWRDLCLKPEWTALVQQMYYSNNKPNQKYFYVTQCFRYERPQKWRYREFTQFWLEILRPKDMDYWIEFKNYCKNVNKLTWDENWMKMNDSNYLQFIAMKMLDEMWVLWECKFNSDVTRGLSYYTSTWFEVECESLWAQKQIIWWWPFDEWIWFAIWVDRIIHI